MTLKDTLYPLQKYDDKLYNKPIITFTPLVRKEVVMKGQQDSVDHLQMLHRPRIVEAIRKGLQQPLVVMLAGPGYGKTQAMSSYIKISNIRTVWLRMSTLDNLISHFWDHLLNSLIQEYPEHVLALQRVAFPETLSEFSVFAKLIDDITRGEKQTIWVFDDYGEINNQQVMEFMHMLVDANLPGLRLVLISNVLDSTESIAFMTRKRALILADDLRFTEDEILSLYELHNIPLMQSELKAIHQYTAGWPLPLHLLVTQHDQLPDLIHQNARLTDRTISHLFEEKFFSSYSEEQQKMMVKLSLLNSFTKEFAIGIYEGNAKEVESFTNHAFVIGELYSDRLFLHHLYRLFLHEKMYLLSTEEIQQLWQEAAQFYMDNGNTVEAVTCYRKCKNYPGMMEAIYHYIQSQSEMAGSTANFFLEHISLLTSEQLKEYPKVDYLRAYIYMILVRLEESEALLCDLEKRLLPEEESHDKHDLLCDVYATLGLVHMMQNNEQFAEDFEKASIHAEFVSPEILAKKSGLMRMHNGNAFSMSDKKAGAKERMERVIHRAAPYMFKVWSGDISGIEYMFSAESAYLSFQMDQARDYAYQCLYKADAYAQYDLVCNAHRMLARIGYMQGDFAEMKTHIDLTVENANEHDNSVLRKIRDNALAWYYVELQDYAKIPRSIMELSKTEGHNLAYGRPQVTYAHYLLNMGEYARMIGMMRHADKGLYLARGIWQERIIRHIMLAAAYSCLGDYDASMDAFWSAYDLCYENGLVTLFIEATDHMERLIQIARQQNRYSFSPEWLDFIEHEAGELSRREDKVREAYRMQNPVKPSVDDNPLSKREREVLQATALGLTREEIAVEQYVSVNTVKTTLRNIYNKLSANNKAEAVSIALAKGYIEGYIST